MSSQYDRIDDRSNETTSILKDDRNSFHKMNKISNERPFSRSVEDLNDTYDREDRLTDTSSASFYSQSAFQLQRQMWLKNRNLLIIIAIIIIGIIIFIAILISEPWKS